VQVSKGAMALRREFPDALSRRSGTPLPGALRTDFMQDRESPTNWRSAKFAFAISGPGWTLLFGSARPTNCRLHSWEVPIAESIYKTPDGEAEIRALYDEAFAGLGSGCQSLTIRTRRYPVRSTPRSVDWVPHACSNSNRFCRV